MEASNLMGGFVACGDEDDEWDINIFFSDENHQLDLGLQTGSVVGGDQYSSSFSSSHDHDHNHNHNQVYFPANQAYNYNNGGGDDDYCYFDQPGLQENIMNLQQQVMQIDDINDFFVPDFSDATESINDLALVENHDVGSVKKPSKLIKRKFKSSSPELMEGTVDDESGIIVAVNKKPRVSKPAVDHQKVKNKKKVAAEPRRQRRKLHKDGDGDDQGKMPKLEQGSSSDDHDTTVVVVSNKAVLGIKKNT